MMLYLLVQLPSLLHLLCWNLMKMVGIAGVGHLFSLMQKQVLSIGASLYVFSFSLGWYLLYASLKLLEWIFFSVWSVLLALLCCWKRTDHGSLVSKLLVFYMLLKFGFYVVTILFYLCWTCHLYLDKLCLFTIINN